MHLNRYAYVDAVQTDRGGRDLSPGARNDDLCG